MVRMRTRVQTTRIHTKLNMVDTFAIQIKHEVAIGESPESCREASVVYTVKNNEETLP